MHANGVPKIVETKICVFVTGLNLIGKPREPVNYNNYQSTSYTTMDCGPSPAILAHAHRYPPHIINYGPPSIPFGNYIQPNMSDGHVGPLRQQGDPRESPSVGVCLQQSPVVIH